MAKKKKPKTSTVKSTDKPAARSQPGKPWIDISNAFILRHFRPTILILFFLSLGLSSIYYIQGHKSPLRSTHTWQNSDMAFFEDWAKYLAKGNWMCDTVLHPFHDWHEMFAKEYFKKYPAVAAPYYTNAMSGSVTDTVASRRAFIDDIYKGKTFHQEPLYPYMLAITYSIFGRDHAWVYFWQFILAALTGVLVFLIGKRLFGPLAGLIGALFVIGCGTIMVFEMVLLRTTLTNFLTVLLLYLYLRALDKPTWQNQALFGAGSGLALLSQSYFILFLVPAWAWLAWTNRKNIRQTAIGAVAFLGAMLIVLSPLVIRNLSVGVPPFAMAGHGAMAYIPMNTKYSAPMESFFIHTPSMVELRHEGKGKMITTALKCLATFDNFNQFWKIYSAKINGMFMWYELPNNMNYYLYKEYAPILGSLPVRYFFIAPLGLAGLLLGLYRYRWRFVPFIIMLIACMLPLFIAGNLARYRTPLAIMLCLSAAFFLIQILQWFWQQKWKEMAIGLGIGILFFIYTSSLVSKSMFTINVNDLDPMYKLHYANKLIKLEQEKNDAEYLKLTTEIMGYLPDYFFKSTLQDRVKASNEAESCRYAANLIQMHAGTLEVLGRQQEAAFYNDRVKILRARADEFSQRVR